MGIFKNYDGDPIGVPTHKHSTLDTQINNSIALASTYDDGFMAAADRVRLTSLKSKMDYLNEKMQTAVYISTPNYAKLMTGYEFNNKLKSVGPYATNVVFTNTAIPSNKINSASIISSNDSAFKVYMYLDGNTVYISPENDNIITQVQDSSRMFYFCDKLTSIDLSNFDASNTTDMGSMFYNCTNLTSLDLSNFDTSNVTNMNGMFYLCSSLTSLDVSNFDTSNVTNMGNMFSRCENLKSLDVSNFDTSKVTDMNNMFSECYNLTSLDLSNFDTSKVTSMYLIFNNCSKLVSLDLTNFDISKLIGMNQMFYNCNNLTSSITIMNPNTTEYENIFTDCSTISPAKFTVNYISGCKTIAQNMVNTKSSNSNVVLGSQVT